jgi:hypothetical protein
LAKVETDAKRILASFGPKEYDALAIAKLPNNGRLNPMFEQMGIPYAPRLLPGTEASQTQKCKADMSKKAPAKKPKVAQFGKAMPTKTIVKRSIVKVIRLKAKPGPKGMSEIELIMAKPIRVSNFFCLSDVHDSSQSRCDEGHRTVETVVERAPRVILFDNLEDDSSSDIHEASPPKRVADVLPPPPPFSHGELPSHTFANLLKVLMLMFCI